MPRTDTAFERQTAVLIGIVLMLATYMVFSLRTLIDPVDPGELFSLKRLTAAAVGTAVFWMVVRASVRLPIHRVRECAPALALRSLAALALVLATRVGYDLFVTGGADAMLARNMRWIMAWAGYFAAALLAYVAIVSARAARHRAVSAFTSREEAVSWFVSEIATWPEAERRQIAGLITARAAYEEADPLLAVLPRN